MKACGHIPVWTGERVLRSNARGRNTYLEEFKRWIVEQARLPGMSMAGLALSNQVNANQLRRWVQLQGKRSLSGAPQARLLPVTMADVTQPSPARSAARPVGAAIEIEVSGAVVRVPDGVSAVTLRTVLDCLRAAAS